MSPEQYIQLQHLGTVPSYNGLAQGGGPVVLSIPPRTQYMTVADLPRPVYTQLGAAARGSGGGGGKGAGTAPAKSKEEKEKEKVERAYNRKPYDGSEDYRRESPKPLRRDSTMPRGATRWNRFAEGAGDPVGLAYDYLGAGQGVADSLKSLSPEQRAETMEGLKLFGELALTQMSGLGLISLARRFQNMLAGLRVGKKLLPPTTFQQPTGLNPRQYPWVRQGTPGSMVNNSGPAHAPTPPWYQNLVRGATP